MAKIIYEKPRKARIIEKEGVRYEGVLYEHGATVEIVAEKTDDDGDKFYYFSIGDIESCIGYYHHRFELLEEDGKPIVVDMNANTREVSTLYCNLKVKMKYGCEVLLKMCVRLFQTGVLSMGHI